MLIVSSEVPWQLLGFNQQVKFQIFYVEPSRRPISPSSVESTFPLVCEQIVSCRTTNFMKPVLTCSHSFMLTIILNCFSASSEFQNCSLQLVGLYHLFFTMILILIHIGLNHTTLDYYFDYLCCDISMILIFISSVVISTCSSWMWPLTLWPLGLQHVNQSL